MDFKCNLNCPAYPTERLCCDNCHRSRTQFVVEDTKQYWTDEFGFWKPGGCALPRDLMPMACRENDCRDKTWVVIRKWRDEKWVDIAAHEVASGHEVIGIGVRPATSELGYSCITTS